MLRGIVTKVFGDQYYVLLSHQSNDWTIGLQCSIANPHERMYLGSNPLNSSCIAPGGMAQSTPQPPQEQKTQVRIPPGYKFF
jgi:hypothetical protein